MPSEYSNLLNDYWILGTNDEYIMQNINDIERNMSMLIVYQLVLL